MARPVYSTRLVSGELVGPGNVGVDIAEGLVVVVRNISFFLQGTLNGASFVSCDIEGLTVLDWGFPDGWAGSEQWEGRLVAPGPTHVGFGQIGNATATLQFNVSGYLLTA